MECFWLQRSQLLRNTRSQHSQKDICFFYTYSLKKHRKPGDTLSVSMGLASFFLGCSSSFTTLISYRSSSIQQLVLFIQMWCDRSVCIEYTVLYQIVFIFKMSALQIDRLKRELDKKNTLLMQSQNKVACLTNDCTAFQQVIRRQNTEIDTLKQQAKKLKSTIEQHQFDRQDVEGRYLLVLKQLQEELQDHKRKYSKMQNKIFPLLDTDSVRLQILTQVQGNHQIQLAHAKQQTQSLRQELHRVRRECQSLKHKLQFNNIAHQQQIRRLRSNRSQQLAADNIDYLSFEMNREIENRLKNSYEQARKEAEYYKDKYFQIERKLQNRMIHQH